MQLRNGSQFDATPQFTAQKSRRVIEAFGGCTDLIGIAEQREIHFGVPVIGSNFDARQRYHADARILDFQPDQIRQFTLDLLSNSQRAGKVTRHGGKPGRAKRQPGFELPLRAQRHQPAGGAYRAGGSQRARHLDNLIHLDLVADFHVVKILQRKAAFESRLDLARIVLEALERIEFACMHHNVVPQ